MNKTTTTATTTTTAKTVRKYNLINPKKKYAHTHTQTHLHTIKETKAHIVCVNNFIF